MARPTVTVRKPRAMSIEMEDHTVLVYVEGPTGQRMRMYVSAGMDGMMRYQIEHNDAVEELQPATELPDTELRWFK